jgi:hypothetical protein
MKNVKEKKSMPDGQKRDSIADETAHLAGICESSGFISGIACCVGGVCDKNDQDAALTYAKNICSPVGVTNLVRTYSY